MVNWPPGQEPTTLLPNNSFINIYDFTNISDVSDYLVKVSTNKTLFDGYHAWRTEYVVDLGRYGECNLCKELHQNHSRQSVDVEAWLQNDICYPYTVSMEVRTGRGGARDIHFYTYTNQTPYMMSLSLTVQKLRPRSRGFFLPQSLRQRDRVTNRTKTRCPEFHSGGIKIYSNEKLIMVRFVQLLFTELCTITSTFFVHW